jgi:hypothetical protein
MKNLTAVLFLLLTVNVFSQEPTIITSDEYFLGLSSIDHENGEFFVLNEAQGFLKNYNVYLERGDFKDTGNSICINELVIPYDSIEEEVVITKLSKKESNSDAGDYIVEIKSYNPINNEVTKVITASSFWTNRLDYKRVVYTVIMKNNDVFAFVK